MWAVASDQTYPLHVCNQHDSHEALAEIAVSVDAENLTLRHPSAMTPLLIPLNHDVMARERVEIGPVSRSSPSSTAESEGQMARTWLTKLLAVGDLAKFTFSLVRLPSDSTRDLRKDSRYSDLYDPSRTFTQVAFADTAQIHLVNKSSVNALELASAVPFRPNLVISGAEAFDEDHWQELRVGDVGLQVCMPALRCRVVDNKQTPDFEKPKRSILATLHKRRKAKLRSGCAFGLKLNCMRPQAGDSDSCETSRTLKVGDEVVVTRRAPTSILEPTTMKEMRQWTNDSSHSCAVASFKLGLWVALAIALAYYVGLAAIIVSSR